VLNACIPNWNSEVSNVLLLQKHTLKNSREDAAVEENAPDSTENERYGVQRFHFITY